MHMSNCTKNFRTNNFTQFFIANKIFAVKVISELFFYIAGYTSCSTPWSGASAFFFTEGRIELLGNNYWEI